MSIGDLLTILAVCANGACIVFFWWALDGKLREIHNDIKRMRKP